MLRPGVEREVSSNFAPLFSSEQRSHNASRELLEIIADNLSKVGWSRGCFSALDSRGRTIWIAAHPDLGV
jgi:hypothetical protein